MGGLPSGPLGPGNLYRFLPPLIGTVNSFITSHHFILFIIHPHCYICNLGLVQLYITIYYNVHSCQQKSIGMKFSKSQTGSDMRYSYHHNSSRFTFPYLRIRAVSLSSIHYNQSHRVYINRRRQYICLI